MGLFQHALNAAKDFVENPVHATERFIELNFGSGGVGGQDPAQIYSWFHDGPGTGSYDIAKGTFDKAAGTYQRTADTVNGVQQQLANGWQGPASEAAQATMRPVVGELDAMHGAAVTASSNLGGQSGTFNDTKNKVTPVPKNPPQGGGLAALNPVNMAQGAVADLSVADYQQQAHANQGAYTSYGHSTSPQQAGLPADSGAPAPGGPDTGLQPGKVAPGHSGGPGAPVPSGPGGGFADPGGTSTQSAPGYHPPQTPGGPPPGAPGGPAAPPGGGSWTGANPRFGASPSLPSPVGGPGPSAGLSGLNSELGALSSGVAGSAGAGMAGMGSDEFKGARGGRFGSGSGARGGAGAAGGEEGAGGRTGARAGAAAAAAAAEERGLTSGAKGAAGGPMGAGAGKKKEEDGEHKTAGYLIHSEHGKELVGDLDAVAPEVIGESPDETAARHGE